MSLKLSSLFPRAMFPSDGISNILGAKERHQLLFLLEDLGIKSARSLVSAFHMRRSGRKPPKR